MPSSGGRKPRSFSSVRKPAQASVDSEPAGAPNEHRLAVGGEAPSGQHRLGRRAGVHPEVRRLQEQVVQYHVVESSGRPDSELVPDGLTDAAHCRTGQGGLGAQHLAQGGFDIPIRQAPHPAGDHPRLQRVGASHTIAEQPGAKPLVGPPQLRALQLHRPHGRLHRRRRLIAVAIPVRTVLLSAFIAGPRQERLHLGFHGSLHQQPHRQQTDVLQVLTISQFPRGSIN
jgi:hypothetical protein